jgi:hypothetical protein
VKPIWGAESYIESCAVAACFDLVAILICALVRLYVTDKLRRRAGLALRIASQIFTPDRS